MLYGINGMHLSYFMKNASKRESGESPELSP